MLHLDQIQINNTFIANAEDLDVAVPMDDLLEYSDNYSMTSGSLSNYYRDKKNDDVNENNNANNKTATSKSFEYNTKITGSTPDKNSRLDTKVVLSLKYLSNFWRSLNLPSINCEIELAIMVKKFCNI